MSCCTCCSVAVLVIAVGTGTWVITAVIPKYLSQRLWTVLRDYWAICPKTPCLSIQLLEKRERKFGNRQKILLNLQCQKSKTDAINSKTTTTKRE